MVIRVRPVAGACSTEGAHAGRGLLRGFVTPPAWRRMNLKQGCPEKRVSQCFWVDEARPNTPRDAFMRPRSFYTGRNCPHQPCDVKHSRLASVRAETPGFGTLGRLWSLRSLSRFEGLREVLRIGGLIVESLHDGSYHFGSALGVPDSPTLWFLQRKSSIVEVCACV